MSASIVKLIDHAVLQPTQTDADVRAACALCAELGVASVCVKPSHVPLAAECLRGFRRAGEHRDRLPPRRHDDRDQGRRDAPRLPSRAPGKSTWSPTSARCSPAIGHYVEADIRAVVDAARSHGAITKVIFETGLLPNDEVKIRLCQVSEAAGAAFVKTSTGFGFVKGAGRRDDRHRRHRARHQADACHLRPADVQVKASGGIRSYADARRFVDLGATRLGTSGTKEIAAGERGEQAKSTASY